ncbi:hypothetical protein [Streptomyces indicus]|uniref:Uncharacterized protein n=1 Tax=Streptomyces indicus TaxID=417292 RepID=A0A1G9D4E8_9ACTN|nr:hypothetical protein [Streptomyces indicus]SDK58574.1 hypothetical protein SAMN05421806_1094 [Streptomyces indicus]
MTDHPARRTLERLRAADWEATGSWDHANSRALLMREHLRRAALWAQAAGAADSWPFFDVTEALGVTVELPAEVEADLEGFLKERGPASLRRTCRGAVRWAALKASDAQLPDLPDPYEPLLAMYERGGGFYVEQFIDLDGISVPLGTLEESLGVEPFLTLAPVVLDALDAEGQITYYAKIGEGHPRSSPRGIVRRRVDEDATYDEAFTRNLRWEPTEYLRLYALGHNDIDHVQISESEAAAFIDSAVARLGARS